MKKKGLIKYPCKTRYVCLYSIDMTITESGKPYLIEINGSNSGFDGPLIAYKDKSIQETLVSALKEITLGGNIFVVTKLVNFGVLPKGYLDKMVKDSLYFRILKNVHTNLNNGAIGLNWARLCSDKPPSSKGAGTSLDYLFEHDKRFKRVVLNVSDPSYVIPETYFEDKANKGLLAFKKNFAGNAEAIPIKDQDVLWFRGPSMAYGEPLSRGIHINPEFPCDFISDNKLFTYHLLKKYFPDNIPAHIPQRNRCSSSEEINALLKRTTCQWFIRKPLVATQARGIEFIHRQEIESYRNRVLSLEINEAGLSTLPNVFDGVAEFIAANALSNDLQLISEFTPSKPIFYPGTANYHSGCIRSLALLYEDENNRPRTKFLGAYWRLSPIPVDGDGLLWERYVASQSQGAYCEKLSIRDMETARSFCDDILIAYTKSISTLPLSREGFYAWEKSFWCSQYKNNVTCFKDDAVWNYFMVKIAEYEASIVELKKAAEQSYYRQNPQNFFPCDQVSRMHLPYLINDCQRIIIR